MKMDIRPLAFAERMQSLANVQETTPLAMICDRIADGQSLARYAAEHGVTRSTLSRYVHSLPGAKEDLRVAREAGAHALVDQARDILEKLVSPDRDAIALAKAKVELTMWYAERLNQTDFGGAKQQVNVQVNMGSLSLDAMRNRVVTARVVQHEELPTLPTPAENAALRPHRLPHDVT